MQIKEKQVRKFLSKKIQQLNNIVADLDSLVTEIGSEYYRVSIFGSARIKKDTNDYNQVYDLARKLAQNKADIVTGGGPGLMEAANSGAKDGSSDSKSFGLHIDLPFGHMDMIRSSIMPRESMSIWALSNECDVAYFSIQLA